MVKIMLDAGHYGKYNRSPAVKDYYESLRMWALCGYLKEELEKRNFFVATTREDLYKDVPVTERGRMAKGYDLFLSLHTNADPKGVSAADRVEVYAPFDNINMSWELAEKLATAVADTMGISRRYVKTRKSDKGNYEYYGVLRGARSVGCPLYYLIEHSFHTNSYAAKWLMSDDNLKKLARAEAEVISAYFKTFLRGDINGNGFIDSNDYFLAKRAVLGTYLLTPEEELRADINGDGKITSRDYMLIKRAYFEDN